MKSFTIDSSWFAKQRCASEGLADDLAAQSGWLPVSVPGVIHLDLMANGRIPDPFVALNEQAVQWVAEADWLYRCSFDLPEGCGGTQAVDLCFAGLDTFATVWLNDEQILSCDNMFLPQRVRVDHLLRATGNQLVILFESALRRGKEREAQHGTLHCWNGDASRLYVRKAQYHYGWDWGPSLLTAGPWRPIRLEAYDARIVNLHCPAEVAPDLQRATLPVHVTVDSAGTDAELALRLELYGPSGALIDRATLGVAAGEVLHSFHINNPQLWWPRGYGAQHQYRLVAMLQSRQNPDACLDRQEQRLGLRRLRLIQEPLSAEPGKSFLFEINNTPIFCGGANWIPADSFLPRLSAQRYRAWLEAAAEANMLMLRVWGGGIYEEDVFYDLCDELGLLVWQDFMFACGIYPAQDWFISSVRAEAAAALRRLRHHPSLVLWCGNNEDYSIAESRGLYDESFAGDFTRTAFPAREIYERVLPSLCAMLDPTRPYWPGSPYGGAQSNEPTVGDRHTWEVWHGPMAAYQRYGAYAGRFVSEFGMQAAPARATLERVLPPAERYVGSRTLEHHNKAEGGTRRLAVYLSDQLRPVTKLDDYIYATQVVQAEALATALRLWRRRWGGPGRYAVAGALLWQLNDCWPVTSWAIVDSELRPKAAYYAVRRELAPLAAGLARNGRAADVWLVNSTTEAVEAELVLQSWTLSGEQRTAGRRAVTLPPNQALDLEPFVLEADDLVLSAQLLVRGAVAARSALWPEPFKYYAFPDPGIAVERLDDQRLRLSAARPAKGVLLSAADGVRWSDNYLDLLPGDEQIVVASGLADDKIAVRWLRG